DPRLLRGGLHRGGRARRRADAGRGDRHRRAQAPQLAAVRGVRARQARAQPRARRLAARRRRRDGPAQRARRLHPPQRGREHLGGPGRAHHRLQPGGEGPVLRPGRRQGLPAPHVLRDPGGGAAPV
ncbi:MAG: 1,2-phenylacetyl-CoA epoxidase, subunit B, partial [uncultured Pseudonocardia sp.]